MNIPVPQVPGEWSTANTKEGKEAIVQVQEILKKYGK